MAGVLPGVDHRRRMGKNYRHQKSGGGGSGRLELSLSSGRQGNPPVIDISNMDETVVRALHRLEQKLGYQCSSSRSREIQRSKNGNPQKELHKKDTGQVGRPRLFKFCNCKTLGNFCSVCMKDFKTTEQNKL